MEQHSVRIDGNQLIYCRPSGELSVKSFEAKILKALEARRGIIILLGPGGGDPHKCFYNPLLVDWTLAVVWRAELPSSAGANAYVDVEVSDDIIRAWSWDGWHCIIDETSGRIKSCEFVK